MKKFRFTYCYRHSSGIVGILLLCAILLALLWLPSANTASSGSTSTVPAETTQRTGTEYIPPANLYGPEDFAYDGNYLACLAGDYSLGIDVSQFQGDIDWQQVKNAGFQFVFIRIGGRGYGQEGALYTDALCQQYYTEAKAAGLKIGAYFFSQAITPAEAREEAEYALVLSASWELDLPIAYDWEYISDTARTANMDPDTLTSCVLEFCDVIEAGGRSAMLYTNPSYANIGLHLEAIAHIPIWLAFYTDEMTYPYRIVAWQYTMYGSVPGISTPVDINLYLGKL